MAQTTHRATRAKIMAALLAALGALLLWAASASAITFGVDVGRGNGEYAEVAHSGATVLRFPLDKSNTSNGTNWSFYNSMFEEAWQHGITMQPVLIRSIGETTPFPTSGEYAGWDEWVKKVIAQYGPNGAFWSGKANPRPVTSWEVWNEPNLPGNNPGGTTVQPENYARFLVSSANAIKAVQPGASVLVGGLYLPGGRYYRSFLEEASRVSGWSGAFSALAIHPYAFINKTTELEELVRGARSAANAFGGSGKPLVINELGWPTKVGKEEEETNKVQAVSEAEQASLLKQGFDWIKGHAAELNISSVYWYNMRDDTLKLKWDHYCGLRRDDGSYKSAWYAFEEETGAPRWPSTSPPPSVETKATTNITETQATLNGSVNPNGSETTYHFEYGKTTSYGSSIPVPDAGAGAGTSAVTVYLTPNTLLPRTRYHFRLAATNSAGTIYGADKAFTTGVKWSVRNSNSSGNPQVAFWFGLPGETRVSGDWDGNSTSTPGVYNPTTGVWKLRNSNTTGSPFTTFQYGGGPWTTPVVGDWNGDGKDSIGVYDPSAGNWNLKNTNESGNPDYSFQYGGGPWTKPVVGDWNGDDKDTVGVYDPSAGNWNLRDTLTFGNPTYSFQYGGGVWSGAVAGDWNGDGKDSIGVYDPNTGNWNLKNANQAGNPDYSFQYGGSQYQFTVGDWDGNGTDTPALSEANAPTAIEYQLRNKNESGGPEVLFEWGSPEQTPFGGDWNGDKVTTTGRYEPVSGIWRLRTTNSAGIFTPIEFQYGGSQFKPVVGDWDGNGTDTVGLYEPQEGRWELRNENSEGNPQLNFQYGGSQYIPVVGDWDGNGTDTVGLYEPISGQWVLRNSNSEGNSDLSFQYGGSQYIPVVGDWDGNGTDTVGLYEPQSSQWVLRNTNSSGPPDLSFPYGGSQFKPVVGDWDGNGTDTIGLVTW